MKKEIKEVKKSKVDSLVYWVVQVIFAITSVAGLQHFLQPVDPILSTTISVTLVACLFYITYRNR